MAVTRINNNQITDASAGNVLLGINANTKIQNFSITAGKIANNLTYGSDLTVTGNLTVNGQSTAIDTTITTIEDPVIVLASTQTGSPVVDIGFIGERGTSNNIAFVWDESSGEFVTAFTDTSETSTTINIISYSNFHTNDANIGGNAVINGTTSLVGNLVGAVQATGNITGGNLLTAGLITATGNVTGGNVLTDGIVSSTGTVTGGNIATGGTVSATATITGGNIATGGTVSATGDVTGGNIATGGTVSAAGNITAGSGSFFLGNGSQLTGVAASSANAETLTGTFLAPNVLASSLTSVGDLTSLSVVGTTQSGNLQTAGLVSATGTVTGGNINTAGNVSATGEITGGNVFTGGLISATGDITGGSLTTSGTANVTGTITGSNIQSNGFLSAVGTATVGNLATGGTVSATGNVTGGNVLTGGIVSSTGDVTGGNLATAGTASATGNITGGNILTGGVVSATGNITGANVNAPQVYGSTALTLVAGTGNINLETLGNVVLANTFINGVAYPAQDQDAASKIYVDNLVSTGISYHEAVVATTNTDLATATGGTITYAQPNGAANGVGATLTTTGTFNLIDTANVQSAGARILVKDQANAVQNGVYVWSNATVITRATNEDTYGVGNAFLLGLNDYFFTTSGNVNAGAAFVVDAPAGTITFGTSNIQFAQFSSSQVYSANTAAGISLSGTVFSAKIDNNTTAFDGLGNIIVKAGANLTTPNIGAATGTSLSTTGTITGGNLATGGTASAAGTITGGNLATGGTASAAGTITGGNLDTGGTVSATGTATLGNVATGGTVSATGNVTGANIVTGGLITSTGNITGGNVLTGGLVSAAGTVTGGNLATGGTASVTGTITGGNLATGGTVSATGTATVGNLATGGTVSATGNVTGGNILSGGLGSFTGNVTAANFIGNISGNISAPGANTQVEFNDNGITNATAGFTFDKTSNLVTVGGNVNASNFNGNVFGTSVSASGTVTAASTVGGVITGSSASVTGTVTAASTVGGVITGSTASLSGNVTSANLALTTGIIDGPAAGRITINGSDIDTDFAVDGDTVANVFYVDAGTGTASFGTSTQTVNAIVAFNSTNSILFPVGNIGTRPATGVTGMVRFNTTNNNLEVYDNSEWVAVGTPEFTVIDNEQFFGDGSTVAFTLGSTQTTNSCIVSINGVVQIPITAYSVAGTDPTCVLTFTEAPAEGDAIEVRQLTTTTSVTSISNSSGNAVIAASDTAALINVTGDLSVTGSILGGNINSTAITNGTSNMSVIASGGNIQANIAGTTVQTISAGLVAITGDLSVTGNATLSGNILGDRIQNGTTSFDIQTASGNANINIGGTGNLAVFAPGALNMTGNITPTANITYDLGTTTNRWKDLWLANSTIYLGNAQISANATALIFTNPDGGETVLAGAAGNITGGNVLTAGVVSATGGITSGGYTNAPTTATVFGTALISFPNGTSNVEISGQTGSISAAGNVTGGNILTGGIVSATGNINGANLFLNSNTYIVGGATSTAVAESVVGNVSLTSNGNTFTRFEVRAGGPFAYNGIFNAYANTSVNPQVQILGNPGSVSAVGNITGGNLSVGTGTVTVGNIVNSNANGVGNIGSTGTRFNQVFALASSAQYADLAEKYTADADYAPGTVIMFGGKQEVTICSNDSCSRVAGVVSTNPAYIMNDGLAAPFVAAVALTGRVPCLVTGTVRKGDLMVSAGNGVARAEADPRVGTVIGKALADSEGNATIEVVVGRF
jgi:hypothetical protein